MKICVLTSVHPPDDNRINKEIRTLKKAGYDISFVSPEGNFNINGVKYYKLKKRTNRFSRIFFSRNEILKLVKKINADICHFHDPELIPIGLKLKKIGKSVIYDVHEDYPSLFLEKYWIPKIIRKFLYRFFSKYENKAVKKFDGIVVVVEEQLNRLKPKKSAIIPNYPEKSIFSDIKHNNEKTKILKFVYLGSIHSGRAIKELLTAAEKLNEGNFRFHLTLIGPVYGEDYKEIIDGITSKYKNIKYYERLPYREALRQTKENDVGILINKRTAQREYSLPNKLFEYMHLGLSMIVSDFKKWRNILSSPSCALFVDPDSSDDIAKKMKSLISNRELTEELKKNALEKAPNYTWEKLESTLLEFYSSLNIAKGENK